VSTAITIITAVFNRANTVRATMESVERQSYTPIEHVIIDGASTDGSQQIVAAVHVDDLILRVIVSEPDNGVYDAINKGIRMSTSDVIGLLHSDDVFAAPTTIAKVMNVFERDPTIDIVYGDLVIFDRDLQKPIRYWRTGDFGIGALHKGWMPPHTTLFVRRTVFEKHGLYDTSFRVSADYDFILRIFKSGKLNIHYIPEVLVHMRSGGLSSSKYWQIIKEDYRALKINQVGGVMTLACKYLRSTAQLFRKY
jgi:glycosyltransferase involved in cell wall biosynthesis